MNTVHGRNDIVIVSLKWKPCYPFYESIKEYKNKLTNSVVPEPKGSSQYSQEPATGPYPEPTGSNLHSPSQSP
jgi:hypothetical protein